MSDDGLIVKGAAVDKHFLERRDALSPHTSFCSGLIPEGNPFAGVEELRAGGCDNILRPSGAGLATSARAHRIIDDVLPAVGVVVAGEHEVDVVSLENVAERCAVRIGVIAQRAVVYRLVQHDDGPLVRIRRQLGVEVSRLFIQCLLVRGQGNEADALVIDGVSRLGELRGAILWQGFGNCCRSGRT